MARKRFNAEFRDTKPGRPFLDAELDDMGTTGPTAGSGTPGSVRALLSCLTGSLLDGCRS